MFPELEKAISEGRREMKEGIKWKDQSFEEYKDECVKEAEKLVGPRVTAKQKKSLMERITSNGRFAVDREFEYI